MGLLAHLSVSGRWAMSAQQHPASNSRAGELGVEVATGTTVAAIVATGVSALPFRTLAGVTSSAQQDSAECRGEPSEATTSPKAKTSLQPAPPVPVGHTMVGRQFVLRQS